jgi:hypothetical protein
MLDQRLADGTWVTTPIAAGIGPPSTQCADGGCDWRDDGPPVSDTPVPLQLQRCARCGWMRGRYLGDPHPEAP